MYDFSYELMPATEGIISSFIGGIKKLIDRFTKWLSDAIKKIGNLIRNLFRKHKLSVNRPNPEHVSMQTCITNICSNVQDLFTACDDCMTNMFQTLGTTSQSDNNNVNDFRDSFAESAHDIDDKIDMIRNDFFKLDSMHLSDSAVKEGYDSLRQVYGINSKFSQTVKRAKDVHDSCDDGTVKPIIGKIMQMYSYGVSATKKFGQKIIDDIDHDLNDDEYFGLSVRRDDFDMSMDSANINNSTTNGDDIMENIYDNNYFDIYDDENELSEANEFAMTFIEFLAIVVPITVVGIVKHIKTAARNSKMHGTLLSIDKLISSGFPKAAAVSEYRKTCKFLVSKGYLKTDAESNASISYEDLTPEGLKFIKGYYEAIGKIDDANISKIAKAKAAKITSFKTIADFITTILEIVAEGFTGFVLPIGTPFSIPGMLLMPLSGYFNFKNAYQRIQNMKEYNNNKPVDDTKESDGTESAKESVNIFDTDYFDDTAIEDITSCDDSGDSAMEFVNPDVLIHLSLVIDWTKRIIRWVRHSRKNGVFLDVDKIMESSIPEDQAIAEYKKTLKFLIDKKFVKPKITMDSTIIYYNDLTAKGYQFINGYYDKLSKVDTFTITKSVEANSSKLIPIVKAGKVFTSILSAVLWITGAICAAPIEPAFVSLAILGAICAGFDIRLDLGKGNSAEAFYDKHKPTIKDTKSNDENKSAKESISIFDVEYFEV